ncbi:glycoside hydrolase family 17 protein [Teratosphaeria destructans]|uniref:glucan 1,3-beta-glucosidase n=1 Tax=Teratosphaeria destructans TaxID=418781 RepID=A0A9W7T1R3_9PEZI|nr:glycoside hydrolase family 17 protein [Teratosphaeria destructans]
MHVPTLLALASPALAALQKGSFGFALGDKTAKGECKQQSDYEADFDAIKAQTGARIVRDYAASDCNSAANLLPAAKAKDFQVILGVWPDTAEAFEADKQALKTYATQYADQVYAVTVGSETLYRGNFTGEELLGKIKEVKEILPHTKVGTADSWNKFADGTADAVIKGGVDILLANAFSYWQGKQVGDGAVYTYFDDVQQALARVQQISGSLDNIEYWNGETGWPTDGGTNYGPATASTDLAATFYQQGVCGLLKWGINVFYFEAFDEPWKPTSVGTDGQSENEQHWGAMTADRKAKFTLTCN